MKLINPETFIKEMERRCPQDQDPNFYWEAVVVAERLLDLADDNGEVPIFDGITFPSFLSSGAIFFTVSQLLGKIPTYLSISVNGKKISLS